MASPWRSPGSGRARRHRHRHGQQLIVGAGFDPRVQDGDDKLSGSARADEAHGGAGRDVIEGGAGDDRLFGDAGIDTVSYASATSGIQVNLEIVGWQTPEVRAADLVSVSTTGSVCKGDAPGRRCRRQLDQWGRGQRPPLHQSERVREMQLLFGGAEVEHGDLTREPAAPFKRIWLPDGPRVAPSHDRLEGIENLTGSASDDRLAGDAFRKSASRRRGRRPARRPGRQQLPHRRPWRRRPDRRARRQHIRRRRRGGVVAFTGDAGDVIAGFDPNADLLRIDHAAFEIDDCGCSSGRT